jgi:alpha-tubulin suppressor-like RCC1 family protein
MAIMRAAVPRLAVTSRHHAEIGVRMRPAFIGTITRTRLLALVLSGGAGCSDTTALKPESTWKSLGADYDCTCELAPNGAAYCWGGNSYGQLGDGSTDSATAFARLTPVAVVGGQTFTSLTVRYAHVCGLTAGGAAYCWGLDAYGQLGDGSWVDSSAPVAVAGGATHARLSAGWGQACGVTFSGAASCWGDDAYGQLGDGSGTSSDTPMPVAGGLPFVSIAAGSIHTCALTNFGGAYCWGLNTTGRIGDDTTADEATPVAVANR